MGVSVDAMAAEERDAPQQQANMAHLPDLLRGESYNVVGPTLVIKYHRPTHLTPETKRLERQRIRIPARPRGCFTPSRPYARAEAMSAGSLRRRQSTPPQVFHGHIRESAVGEEIREDGGEFMFPASIAGKAANEWEEQDCVHDRCRHGRTSGQGTKWP